MENNQSESTTENKFISTKAIFNCGINVAKVMSIAYGSNTPAEKLQNVKPIIDLENLTDDAKIKFISDLFSGNAIVADLRLLLLIPLLRARMIGLPSV